MSRLVLAVILLVLSGCATMSQMTAGREYEPSWDCGEPASDAASHSVPTESSGESGR